MNFSIILAHSVTIKLARASLNNNIAYGHLQYKSYDSNTIMTMDQDNPLMANDFLVEFRFF